MYGFLIIYMDKIASRKNWNFIYILFINVRCSIIARLYVSVGWTTVLDSLLSTGMIVEYAERCPICAIAAVRSVLAGVVGMRMPWQFHKLIPYVCVCVCVWARLCRLHVWCVCDAFRVKDGIAMWMCLSRRCGKRVDNGVPLYLSVTCSFVPSIVTPTCQRCSFTTSTQFNLFRPFYHHQHACRP